MGGRREVICITAGHHRQPDFLRKNVSISWKIDIIFRERGVQTAQGNFSDLHKIHMRIASAIITTLTCDDCIKQAGSSLILYFYVDPCLSSQTRNVSIFHLAQKKLRLIMIFFFFSNTASNCQERYQKMNFWTYSGYVIFFCLLKISTSKENETHIFQNTEGMNMSQCY